MILAGTFGLMVAYPLLAVGIYDFSRPEYVTVLTRQEQYRVIDGYRCWQDRETRRLACYEPRQIIRTGMGEDAAKRLARNFRPVFWPVLRFVCYVTWIGYEVEQPRDRSDRPDFERTMDYFYVEEATVR